MHRELRAQQDLRDRPDLLVLKAPWVHLARLARLEQPVHRDRWEPRGREACPVRQGLRVPQVPQGQPELQAVSDQLVRLDQPVPRVQLVRQELQDPSGLLAQKEQMGPLALPAPKDLLARPVQPEAPVLPAPQAFLLATLRKTISMKRTCRMEKWF